MAGRSLGVVVALERLLPPAVRELFALLTNLGDAGVLLAVVALCYWFGDRRRGAVALAGVLGAFALTLALKGLFALPRPPASVHVGHATGYGFPSGHAIGATVTGGLVALFLDRGGHPADRSKSVGGVAPSVVAVGVVVALVASSRVVVGVHYVADVAIGVVAGLAYLAALVRIGDRHPRRAFAVAGLLAAAALAANDLTPDVVATVAGVLGASAAWTAFEIPPESPVGVPVALTGLGALGAVGYAGNALATGLPVVFALNLVVPAGIVALPVAVERAGEGSGP